MEDGIAWVERIWEAKAGEVYWGHRDNGRLDNERYSQAY